MPTPGRSRKLKQEKLQREEEARELANERRRKEKAQANSPSSLSRK